MASPPSFFKIWLEPSSPHLPLPAKFVRKHLDKIPENPILILRSIDGELSWRLKFEKLGENYCFTHGWKKVVKDTQLGIGDFLLFKLVNGTTFKFSVYSPSGCEKDFSSIIQVEDREGVIDDVVVVDDDSEDVDNEEEASDAGDEDEDDEDEEDEEEEDDDDEVEVEDDDDEDEDEAEDDDDNGDIDGHDGDPFFMTIFSKNHKNSLRLPAEFTKLAGIKTEGTITMKNPDGKEWQVRVLSEKYANTKRCFLSKGWAAFWRSNELSEGDECVFKYNLREDKLCLAKVKKAGAKAPATEVAQRNRGQRPAEAVKPERGPPPRGRGGHEVVVSEEESVVEVVKRPRGRPPRKKPPT